jgi:hypothetical protein
VENIVEKNSTFQPTTFAGVLQNKNFRFCRMNTGAPVFSTFSTASTTSTSEKDIYSFTDCIGTSKPFPREA